jgi:predicted nuclease of restriction endonuclease-like (RecB) superfamily
MTELQKQVDVERLYGDVCHIVEQARSGAYRAANVYLTLRNWLVGERIAQEDLQGAERAEYGKEVIFTLSERLTKRYGGGFDFGSIYKYIKFYRLFPNILDAVSPKLKSEFGILDAVSPKSEGGNQIVAATRGQLLPWTHYRELIRVDNAEARSWYEQESLREGWSTRVLHRNIGSQYYFRLLQSQVKQPVIDEMHALTAPLQDNLEYIKNPVVVEFLGFRSEDSYTERTLEDRLALHMQRFIMELGKGFAYIGRQQHVHTDIDDYYIDLVFYNYLLKCFFLIDLKTHQITHEDVGQMDMYVRMYDKLKRSEGDNPTIGIILCSETSEDMALYSVLNGSNQLFQAKYLTYLPAKEELLREIETQKNIYLLQQESDSDTTDDTSPSGGSR